MTAQGESVGHIDRVVLDPQTKEVTHLVVEKGFLFKEDKVVPISLVGPATEDQVTLRADAVDLEELPDFEESHYVPAGNQDTPPEPVGWVPPLYMYPPVGAAPAATPYVDVGGTRYVTTRELNIPEGTVALEDGAKVIGCNGEHIGNIETILTEPYENRATHLVIAEGLILKEKRLVPTSWVSHVFEDSVHLAVDADCVEGLPDYKSED